MLEYEAFAPCICSVDPGWQCRSVGGEEMQCSRYSDVASFDLVIHADFPGSYAQMNKNGPRSFEQTLCKIAESLRESTVAAEVLNGVISEAFAISDRFRPAGGGDCFVSSISDVTQGRGETPAGLPAE